jgi:hypothetical protein
VTPQASAVGSVAILQLKIEISRDWQALFR